MLLLIVYSVMNLTYFPFSTDLVEVGFVELQTFSSEIVFNRLKDF